MTNNNNSKFKVANLVKKQPESAAIISKINIDKNKTSNKYRILNNIGLNNITRDTNNRIKNNEDILQLFPDMELAIRILVSSILSPNDMISNKLSFNSPNIKITGNVKQAITKTIEEYIGDNYKLEDNLYNIIKESLFVKGAYIEAIIPESSVDDVINGYVNNNKTISTESFISYFTKQTNNNGINLLSSTSFTTSVEANRSVIEVNESDLGIEVLDNYNVLRLPNNILKMQKKNIENKLNKGFDISNENAINDLFSIKNNYKYEDIVELNNLEDTSRKSLSKPMIIRLPTEAVIPVHVLNDPTKHLGYFVLLDMNGVPINKDSLLEQNNMNDALGYNSDPYNSKFGLIAKAKRSLDSMSNFTPTIDDIETIYSEIVENMIKNKLNKGAYGELADISVEADIYRTMFYRSLKNKQTKLLFLPSELVSYFAFEYRDNGTGRSLLEKSSVLFSVRAILLFAKLMAQLKNSVSVTKVTAQIDPDDPDPEATMDAVVNNALKTRQTTLPFGLTNLNNLVEWAHGVGFKFEFQGDGLPQMKIETSEENTSKTVPETELEENINKFIYQSFGLTPEMIDAAYQADYAVTIVSHNILFAKYIKQLQNIFNPLIRKHVQKIILNDPILQNEIKDIIMANIVDIRSTIKKDIKASTDIENVKDIDICNYIIKQYSKNVDVFLPEPEINEADSLGKAYEAYSGNLDKYLDSIVSEDALPSNYVGRLAEQLPDLKKVIKSMLLKKWASENNYLPEVNDIVTYDVDGKPIFDLVNEFMLFIENMYGTMSPMFDKIAKNKDKMDKKLAKALDKLGSGGGMGGDDYGSDDSSGDESGGEEGDDTGMDMDIGGDEEGDTGDTGSEDESGSESDNESNDSEDGASDESNEESSDESDSESKSDSSGEDSGDDKSDDSGDDKLNIIK